MKKNSNKIIGALIGSIAVLAGMISYAAINDQGVEERAIKKAQAKKIESTSRALTGNNDADSNIQITEPFSHSQNVEDSNKSGEVRVTPETFGSDDSIYVVCIGRDVVDIEDGSFSNLKNLQEIRVDSSNPYYTALNGCLYTKDFSTLICVPQNTTKVQVVASIKGYTPHALDGLEQSRIDKLDSVLDGSYYAKKETAYPTTQILERYASTEVGPQTSELIRVRNEELHPTTQILERYASTDVGPQTSELNRLKEESTPSYSSIAERPQDRNDQSTTNNNETIVNNNAPQTNNDHSNNVNIDKPVVDIGTGDDQQKPSRPGTTDFSQYVYEDNGYVCFKYTGSGDSHIIVPEGVEWIKGFTDSGLKFNTDITSIELPSTLKKMSMYCMFGYEDGDTNWYNCLYQCKNLQTVTGSSSGYNGKGSTVVRPLGSIMVWSSGSRIPYDEQAYTNYY